MAADTVAPTGLGSVIGEVVAGLFVGTILASLLNVRLGTVLIAWAARIRSGPRR